MLEFRSVMLFSENPGKLAEFYKEVFQKEPDWKDNGYFGFTVGSGFLMIGPHDKVHGKSINPERIMFNFEANDVVSEFKRINKLEVKVVAEPYYPGKDDDMWIATFADPDGNYFQLTTPWNNGVN